ncbi:hypothetical protein NQ317_018200 [Molorchus minor]|uniref:Major facilitator superfamily (MFS) profile domain-containing protein n=1 Tax=Molorchus minor TaxID=1323400 RepID=A0ABQ9JH06_9CUCU|nr:hypothetical protein NQ317_018200 [Molorchus minor]
MSEEHFLTLGPFNVFFLVSSGSGGVSHNGEALVGFHEDALSQAAMGKAQLLLAVVLGLGLAADCSELTILGYILPAAELHLCIGEHRKGWLVSITLLAMAGGSFAWGILGDHLGRRRALISALSVAVLFSAVASVMPTYGTFMTARFCSGLGVSGAFPLTFSYLAETCSRSTRSRYAGVLHSMWPLGAIYTSLVAHFTMPTLGADIVQDNREHWSSWHRFLILSILPTLACIIGLVWASESPRYLLEASREVEALAVYQRLHRLNKARTQYGLTELELPGRSAYRDRPLSPSRNVLNHGLDTVSRIFSRGVSKSILPDALPHNPSPGHAASPPGVPLHGDFHNTVTGTMRCLGTNVPLAPSSAVKPCTVETGSRRPLRTDSSKLPKWEC